MGQNKETRMKVNGTTVVMGPNGEEKRTGFERMKPLVAKVLIPAMVILSAYGVNCGVKVLKKNAEMQKYSASITDSVGKSIDSDLAEAKVNKLLQLVERFQPKDLEKIGNCIKTIAENSKSAIVVRAAAARIALNIDGATAYSAYEVVMLSEDYGTDEKKLLGAIVWMMKDDLRFRIVNRTGVDDETASEIAVLLLAAANRGILPTTN